MMGRKVNGRFQPLPEAGVTRERTLEAVGWKPVLGLKGQIPINVFSLVRKSRQRAANPSEFGKYLSAR